mgnify:CR=1 FL=1
MKNKIEKGLLGCKALDRKQLYAGRVAILQDDKEFKIVTLIHLDVSGAWNVDGDYKGNTVVDPMFYTIQLFGETAIYNVNMKEYRKIIDNGMINSKEEIECAISTFPFKEGKYSMTCSDCNAVFLGAKNQPYCRECCNKYSTASLLSTPKLKAKRTRIKSKENVSKLLKDAYTYGTEGMLEDIFNEWSENQLKKWQ